MCSEKPADTARYSYSVPGVSPEISQVNVEPTAMARAATSASTCSPEEMKLVFGAEFLNVIPEGEHPIKITVTDENNRTSSATIDILITNAPVRTFRGERAHRGL